MNFTEAKKYKKNAVKNADEYVLKNFHVIIAPLKTDESAKYIEDFLKKPQSFNDESCKDYCSNNEYEVVSFQKEKE
ncbi:hypothetical protein VUJ46_14915 [Chryseobacterium sp. MYb264]|uniref:hypothetical protein n=1 Tax=Chryseobacterium sp. MYb264 TaxID=2745153 RepID=UPI002E13E379|nr:hypothetical protein VUJ46_14915 [Chryseobacterium sp. MYb264]